jgi:hypothetical protein
MTATIWNNQNVPGVYGLNVHKRAATFVLVDHTGA